MNSCEYYRLYITFNSVMMDTISHAAFLSVFLCLLSAMRELANVDFSDNSFSGPIPDRFGDNTTGLNKLEGLALNDNRFTGSM